MSLSTYHTHTVFSDGKNTAEEMIKAAIDAHCAEIGFTDHSPMDFECCWCMKQERVTEYVETLMALREKYKDKIKVYIGIEQDYYSPAPDWKPDFVLGSVHYILKDGHYLEIDKSAETMRENVDKYYGGDVYAYCEDYYALVADIYNKTGCDIIGHFDLVTKFNEKDPTIDESHPRYVKAVNSALESLIKTPATFEVNTGAISRGYRTKPYPNEHIIMDLHARGEKFVFTSDTHSVGSIVWDMNELARIFDMKGISYIKSLSEII